MRIHVIVGRELRLDVGDRDVAPDADHHAFGYLRNVDLAVHHREVEAIGEVVAKQLVARDAERRRVALVLAVDAGEAEAPIDMIGLHRVGQALEIDHRLVELRSVG